MRSEDSGCVSLEMPETSLQRRGRPSGGLRAVKIPHNPATLSRRRGLEGFPLEKKSAFHDMQHVRFIGAQMSYEG